MTNVIVEMLRDGEWKEISSWSNLDIASSLDKGATITLDSGWIQPPWRVVIDGEVKYARASV